MIDQTIVDLYISGMSMPKISQKLGIGRDKVRNILKKHSVETRRKKYELTGQRFGRLFVVSADPREGPVSFWNCRCDCGVDVSVRTQALTTGKTVSCGCYRIDIAAQRFTTHGKSGSIEAKLLYSAKRRAKLQGVEFNLSITDIVVPEFCPVFPEIRLEKTPNSVSDCSPSMDRLVPDGGYTPDNIRVISFRANTIKQNATASELRRVADWIDSEMHSQETNKRLCQNAKPEDITFLAYNERSQRFLPSVNGGVSTLGI